MSQKKSDEQPSSELRKHYFLNRYTIIAPKRNLRPDAFAQHAEPHKTPADSCHFCNNREPAIWQQPRGANWRVKVIANAFPALSIDNPNGYGVQEVVINTPSHDLEFSDLPISHIEEIFEAYRHRLEHLKSVEHIRYVLIFKNDGPVAGASVAHAHCQIFALPLVPPRIEAESDELNHYWDEHNSCAYCDILKWELSQKTRLIAQDKHFVALSPYASASAFEVWLLPIRHVSEFASLSHVELRSLAVFLKTVATRLDSQSISFNYFLQESLASQDHHFALKVEPRTTKYAGAELGTGVTINPVRPEYATQWYLGRV